MRQWLEAELSDPIGSREGMAELGPANGAAVVEHGPHLRDSHHQLSIVLKNQQLVGVLSPHIESPLKEGVCKCRVMEKTEAG